MAAIGFAVAQLRNLFGVVMLTGIFSLTSAVLYVVLDAVDVAFTEAVAGQAGLARVEIRKDLQGIPRAGMIRRAGGS